MRKIIATATFGMLLTGCGLLKMNVNGKTTTLGGESEKAVQDERQQAAGDGDGARGSDGDAGRSDGKSGNADSGEKTAKQMQRENEKARKKERRDMHALVKKTGPT